MIEIKTYSKPKKTGGSGGSSSSTKYISGVISEAEHAGRADKAKRAEVADQANYAGTAASAQNAAYASEAGNLHADAEILQKYLSLEDTVEPQVVKGQVKFEQLLQLLQGFSLGNICGFDGSGNGIINSVASNGFNSASQQGFGIKPDDNGRYSLSITDLIVWGKAVFNELEIRKLSYAGGNVYLSGAGSKLVKVVPVVYNEETGGYITSTDEECDGWKCYILADDGTMATQNWWAVGDQARCQTFNIKPGAYNNASNKEYWRCVVAVSSESEFIVNDGGESLYGDKKFDWIILSKTNCLTGSDIPAEGDAIVLDGHQVQTGDEGSISRTNVLMLETTGADTPRIVGYRGITDFTHEGKDVFVISPSNVTISSSVFKFKAVDGQIITIINDRGAYDPSVGYYYYDRVSYDNAYWTLIYSGDKQPVKGITPTEEAVNGIVYWRKDLSGGIKGDDAVSYSVSLMKELRTIAGHSNQSAVAVSFRKQEGSKSTVSGNIATFGDSASVKCYIDGERSDNMTDWINSGNDYFGYLNYEDAWTGKSVITVVMYIGDNIVASANFSLGQSGEGVVMAYKNDTSRPEPPVTEDLSLLTDGWSRTPQKGGSYEKVSNVSYGNYSVGATESGYSTSEWSEVSDSGETWRKSPAGLSNNGWALMKVSFTTNVDNADVRVVIKAYSETNFDFIQVHELDKEVTGSTSLRKNGVVYTSGNGVEGTYSFTSVGAGQHFFYVSYCKDSSQNANGDYGLFRLDLSENLVSMPSTVWMSQAVLKEGKAVLPWSTPVQITGDDAYRVEVSPSTLVFDTNENGLVDTLSGEYATVTVYKGNQKISADNLSLPSNYATKKCTNVGGSISNSNGEARITIDRIDQETISGDVTVSKSSGQISFPIDVLGERSTLMWVTVNVQVNVSKFTGSVAFDNKRYKVQFDELSNGGGAATKKDLTQATSKFEQTAREISLSVSEKSIGRRNLLAGSAFLREDNHYILSNDARIEMNSGYQGTNCIHVFDATEAGNPHYVGAYWDGSQGGRSVKIEKGKKYTMSCFYKTNDSNAKFSLEAIYTDKETNAKRLGQPKYLSPKGHTVKKVNEWELFTTVIDTTDAESDYIAFNFWEACNVAAGQIEAWICRPMVEEGDKYNGWTLSKDDYDYIGGNMLDNTLSLDKSGSLYDVNGTLTPAGFGESTSIYKSFTYKLKGTVDSFSQLPSSGNVYDDTYYVRNDGTCYAYNGSEFVDVGNDYYYNILGWRKGKPGAFTPFGLDANKDYVFSFMAKGTGLLTAYFYNPDTDVFVESSLGDTNISVNGNASFQLTNKWERYWVHWRPSDSLHKYVLLRLNRSFQSDGSAPITDCYIAQPKLEEGARVTEYTERKSDLVDKASLKAAGIEITSDMVELYGNQVKVSGAKGGTPVAMFENGMLNSNLINADKIMARQLQTTGSNGQSVSIENGLMRVYGTNGRYNIEFGVNLNGEAILSYYDKDGKWLYDLGPNKLDGGQLKESTLDGEKYVSALSFFGTNNFFTSKTYINVAVKQVLRNYSQRLFGNNLFVNDDQEIANNNAAHMGHKPFERVSASDVTTLYRYTAPRQSGTIIKDEIYGLTTSALAKQADGKYFTNNSTLAINGQLTNLAPAGYYFRQSEQVMMAPYPMPSAEIQPSKFPAYSIRYLNINIDSTGTVMNGFNAMMSYLMRTIKIQI